MYRYVYFMSHVISTFIVIHESPTFFARSSELWLATLFRFPSHRYVGLLASLFPLINKSSACTLLSYFSRGLLKEMELSLSNTYPHSVRISRDVIDIYATLHASDLQRDYPHRSKTRESDPEELTTPCYINIIRSSRHEKDCAQVSLQFIPE